MNVTIDKPRGKELANLLYKAFREEGILGQREMPEDDLPYGVTAGSIEHLYYITMTVSIDYMRDADSLWASSRRTFEDPETRYLFYPDKIYETPVQKVITDMQKHSLSLRPRNDAFIWRTVALSFLKKYSGDPRNLFDMYNWDADKILDAVKKGRHPLGGKEAWDFPFLRGDKIGPLWLRMLRDNVGLELKNLDRIPIPVDIHVARSTLALGVVRGSYSGKIGPIFELIREAWFQAVEGLTREDGSRMIALDVDEPLWHLSKNGCTYRSLEGYCPQNKGYICGGYCVKGLVKIGSKSSVELDT